MKLFKGENNNTEKVEEGVYVEEKISLLANVTIVDNITLSDLEANCQRLE